jgi:hypothetical protein
MHIAAATYIINCLRPNGSLVESFSIQNLKKVLIGYIITFNSALILDSVINTNKCNLKCRVHVVCLHKAS